MEGGWGEGWTAGGELRIDGGGVALASCRLGDKVKKSKTSHLYNALK